MSNVPMSNPEMMLAYHDPFPTARGGCIQLRSGRIVACSGCGFNYSADAAMSWCEPYEGQYVNGEKPMLQNLVELGNDILGATERRMPEGVPHTKANLAYKKLAFTTSSDMGKTWSEPNMMTNIPLPAHAWCNTLFRTSRGRIIQPCYMSLRQHTPNDRWPLQGAWDSNGKFVSTGAHYYDPAFCTSYVLYSDDDGETC